MHPVLQTQWGVLPFILQKHSYCVQPRIAFGPLVLIACWTGTHDGKRTAAGVPAHYTAMQACQHTRHTQPVYLVALLASLLSCSLHSVTRIRMSAWDRAGVLGFCWDKEWEPGSNTSYPSESQAQPNLQAASLSLKTPSHPPNLNSGGLLKSPCPSKSSPPPTPPKKPQSLASGGLLKIEDILPFFPDFVTIDNFREAICESLTRYNAAIEGLKEEMDEATAIAAAVRKDIAVLGCRWVK